MPDLCSACNGSGEGNYSESTCTQCKGSGHFNGSISMKQINNSPLSLEDKLIIVHSLIDHKLVLDGLTKECAGIVTRQRERAIAIISSTPIDKLFFHTANASFKLNNQGCAYYSGISVNAHITNLMLMLVNPYS